MKVIDDYIMNADRQFSLTVKVADGAEITTSKTVVTLTDNDGDPYTAFQGRWYFNAIDAFTGNTVKKQVNRHYSRPGVHRLQAEVLLLGVQPLRLQRDDDAQLPMDVRRSKQDRYDRS